MKTALVIGSGGQDGRLLCELLLKRDYRVLGIDQGSVQGLAAKVDITDSSQVTELVRSQQPAELYHVAAVHESSEEKGAEGVQAFQRAYAVNFFSLVSFLEAMRVHAPGARIFYAASSHVFGHVFGNPSQEVQDEETPLSPDSIYGMTKADGLHACRMYRAKHGLFASAGILYNHESAYRPAKFLSKKIIQTALDIRKTGRGELVLGDLSAVIDWGYAPEYVDAMTRILSVDAPGEFVIATGQRHTVQEFVREAFSAVGLDWKAHVREDRSIPLRKGPVRIGNPSKLSRATGWKPERGFAEMVRQLVQDVSEGAQNG